MSQQIIYAAVGFLAFLVIVYFYLRATAVEDRNDFEVEETLPDDDDEPVKGDTDDEFMIIENER